MKLVYLPALSRDALSAHWARTPLNPLDPRLRGTAAHHPHALASYWGWRTQRFTWHPGDFMFGDSGGYSALTLGVTIDPREAIRWQVRFCRVGPILDFPPVDRWSQWRECLDRTVVDTKAALPLYLRALDAGTSFRWWGVVHGRTPDELEEWWAAISHVYPFTGEGEGWAFKPYPLNTPEGMATVLEFIQQRGIRRAHFFATTGRYAVETLCCLGPQRGLEIATVDSFSALVAR